MLQARSDTVDLVLDGLRDTAASTPRRAESCSPPGDDAAADEPKEAACWAVSHSDLDRSRTTTQTAP